MPDPCSRKRPSQAEDSLPGSNDPQTGFAGAEHDQIGAPHVECRQLLSREDAVVGVEGIVRRVGTGEHQTGEKHGFVSARASSARPSAVPRELALAVRRRKEAMGCEVNAPLVQISAIASTSTAVPSSGA